MNTAEIIPQAYRSTASSNFFLSSALASLWKPVRSKMPAKGPTKHIINKLLIYIESFCVEHVEEPGMQAFQGSRHKTF